MKLLFPHFLKKIVDKLLLKLASTLRQHLARTPLIWGDPERLQIGNNVHLVDATINLRSGRVIIEDNAFLGHNVMLLTGKHSVSLSGAERHKSVPASGRDIIIRNGAWIASGSIIIGPSDIGADAVVAAGSVVTGNVPARTIVSGNPAKILRTIDAPDDGS